MTSTDTGLRVRRRAGAERPKGFRPDIEGMRAVAILLVLVYHAGLPFLPGGFVGVDVFFVISGFLITGLLIRELETKGRVSLPRFYARRAKRLLPATALVLVVTTFLTWLTSSVVEWRTFGLDIVGAATYVVNWVLAGRAVDYLAEDVSASPVQHFWSLAVEEQFYIVWPLLLIAVGWWVARRGSARLRPVMTAAILVVIVPSFLWSLHLTGANPERAFFVSTTRLWELGIGAFVAIGALLWARLPRTFAVVLGWAGLAAVVLSGFVIDTRTPWPGYHALLPTLGTAAVIIAGFTSGRSGAAGILSRPSMVWVGGLSYSLYLWHWPLLVSADAYWDGLSPLAGTAVALLSVVPAWLSLRYVENPLRFSRSLSASNRFTLSLGANFTAVGVVAGLLLVLAVPTSSAPGSSTAAGAGAITQGGGQRDGGARTDAPTTTSDGTPPPGSVASLALVDGFVPAATEATQDVPAGYDDGCQQNQSDPEPIRCDYGDPQGEVTIAVVGDSKILQWQSVLDQIGKDEGWHLVSYTKSACGFHSGMQVAKGGPYTSCAQWNDLVMQEIVDLDPDLVLTTQRNFQALTDESDPSTLSEDAMLPAIVETWQELADHGIPVLGMLDNAAPDISVYECVAEHPDDLAACTFDKQEGIDNSSAPLFEAAAEQVPDVRLLDVRDAICPDPQTCVPVIGGVLVYRQTSHITDTYARSLEPLVKEEMVPLVEQMAGGGGR
ncbi:acyltransferase family protein [Ornithinimicrobium avium]|uniref:acyltransferase family protein n=1 Tax=Ornithinimicrobium avium TaxID=2283195 RepID=UPI0013B3851C|nr:acyltransferase family protein [Ornithinimicrobium avium]